MLDPDVTLELLDGVGEEPAAPVRAPQLRDHDGSVVLKGVESHACC